MLMKQKKYWRACAYFPPAWSLANIIVQPHFGWCDLAVWPMTLQFELGLDLLTMNLPTKFHHPMFNHLEVIVLTKKQTNKQTNKEI